MEIGFLIFLALAVVIWIWMAYLGILAAKHDRTLEPFQEKAQMAISVLIPYLGSALILHLVNQHSPEAIPRQLIPWPLRSLVFGIPKKPNRNRDDNEDTAVGGSFHNHHGPGGDGAGGGGD